MFLAGECASVVLHRDLDVAAPAVAAGKAVGFAGWPILEDLDGREEDEVTSSRIARRFIVGRLVRMLVDDDLTVVLERVADQVRRARGELVAHDAPYDEHGRGGSVAPRLGCARAGALRRPGHGARGAGGCRRSAGPPARSAGAVSLRLRHRGCAGAPRGRSTQRASPAASCGVRRTGTRRVTGSR
jgi:hypothetical protein